MYICCNRCFTTKEICRFSCSENKQEHKVYYRCSSPSLSQNKTCRPENEFYEILFGLFWTIISSNFPIELQLQFLLWDPLGPPRGVPEGPRGSQGDPEEELRSVFKGKVARNNGLKNGFFQFLT